MSEEQVQEPVVEETPEATPEPAVEATQPAPEGEGTPEEKPGLTVDDLRIGYVVGLTKDGNFVFELLGEQKGLVELLGINAHADARVKQIYERAQASGDALIHEVGKGLGILNQKIDQLLGVVAPKKPDNNL